MGAYSPAPILNAEVLKKSVERIIRPTMREMVRRGMPFTGVLYAGLMIKDSNPRLVEYNVRFGDPECQVLMMRLGGQILKNSSTQQERAVFVSTSYQHRCVSTCVV